jgi:hypothetical protein
MRLAHSPGMRILFTGIRRTRQYLAGASVTRQPPPTLPPVLMRRQRQVQRLAKLGQLHLCPGGDRSGEVHRPVVVRPPVPGLHRDRKYNPAVRISDQIRIREDLLPPQPRLHHRLQGRDQLQSEQRVIPASRPRVPGAGLSHQRSGVPSARPSPDEDRQHVRSERCRQKLKPGTQRRVDGEHGQDEGHDHEEVRECHGYLCTLGSQPMNAIHGFEPNVNTGPSGSFESRTRATCAPVQSQPATSTQFPVL